MYSDSPVVKQEDGTLSDSAVDISVVEADAYSVKKNVCRCQSPQSLAWRMGEESVCMLQTRVQHVSAR